MKIIQTPARFPPYVGGVEQYTYIVSKKLAERGHDVTVICADESGGESNYEIYNGFDVIRLNYVGKVAQTNLTPSLPAELYREVRDADVVHTHLPTPWTADVSAVMSFITDTPSVVTYHNDIRGDGIASHIADLYNATVMPVTLSLTDQIITTQESYFMDSNISTRFKDKVTTIRNGVDVSRFKPVDIDDKTAREYGFNPEKTNLFFLSVLDEYHDYKGLENLLKTMNHLPEEFQLIVGGDGPKRQYYEEMAHNYGVSSRITFTGYIKDELLPTYYSIADCFVLPSTSSEQEGFGLVLLEALACGTPVVTTDIVGVADRVCEEDLGVVTDEPSPTNLSTAILDVRDIGFNPELARNFCVNHYSWDEIVSELVDLYSGL